MRQYEIEDCEEDAAVGENYRVIEFTSSRDTFNSTELVVGFGNRKTEKVVWIPYGSKITVSGIKYTVLRGRLSPGRRDYSGYDPCCLRDEAGKIKCPYFFRGAIVVVLKRGNRSTVARLKAKNKKPRHRPGAPLLRRIAAVFGR